MAERVSSGIILVEDATQRDFVRTFLKERRHIVERFRVLPLPSGRGSGEQFVRKHYATQVRACRRKAAHMTTLLIVVVDADDRDILFRQQQLEHELRSVDEPPRGEQDPIAILIPRRNIETWIWCLFGYPVDEVTDYTKSAPEGRKLTNHVKSESARTLFLWSRLDAKVPSICVLSLRESFSEWRRIG